MKLLLDTHVWLWLIGDDPRLPARLRAELSNPEHNLVISVASCWEVTIKTAIGKLSLPVPLETLLEDVSRGFEVLAIRLEHVGRLASLPRHHGDPFDRILVAQALVENRAIVTADAMLHRYPAQIFWTT